MISVEEAQARILALKEPVETERVALAEAAGRWAAEDVVALRTQPARDLSAMDGYAIRFADAAGPWTVIGESAAGKQFTDNVSAGEAVRIFTGAVVPEGADTIIIQENVSREGDLVTLTDEAPKKAGQNVRYAGGDFAEGTVVVPKGAELHARHVALAAMAGHGELTVHRKLKVALVSTGNELVAPGARCAEDQIPASNGVMLAAMLRGLPVELSEFPAVEDNLEVLTQQFRALADHDIIVTTGGASVGDHDLIVPALKAAGGEIVFWKIAMRPGKPVIAGRLGAAVTLGLPGNPVSAFVTAMLYLRPLIAHLCGAADPLPQRLTAPTGVDLAANGPRTDHLRAKLVDGMLVPVGVNDSAMLAALSEANALIIRPANTGFTAAGERVDYYPLQI
ncbi:molybdopterin molybdenumtransferase MoeA [Sphingorhabdus pulchriflava]|uniref:Molybdopterin molybdenumtransferase n=1 Tax=Sphingorhabdus pulchriflava TaxID=2292257 RepID=A0A371BHB5_9SPHN|nr:gephyrin-like molybdotransferase Glp [Sphingorhabdus pulchriflava]RDV06938.1 molybdopterin molybdenumtransferase MoeA [Sphingorhabdus pulchriflava]